MTDVTPSRMRSFATRSARTVRASVNHLRHGSELLERLIPENGLLVVGAEYSLETGIVDFCENVPGCMA